MSTRSADASRPTALVTGATRGIGLAIARDLSRTHHVVVHGRDEEALVALADSLPSASPWVADLAGPPFRAPALDRLDVVVHAAGVIGGGAVEGTSRDDWRRVFEVNVFAVSELTRTPCRRSSSRSESVRARSANLLAA